MKEKPNKQPDEPGRSGYLPIGQVLKPQGLLGSVKVRPDTDDPERFLDFGFLYRKMGESAYAPIAISGISVRKGFVYLTLEEDATVSQAEARRDMVLFIDRAHAAPLRENENYIADMIGCRLVDTKGREIGRLKDILQPGAQDVYVVTTPEGAMMIPALRHVILAVDTDEKLIMVDEDRMQEVAVLAD
ncbi:MAG: ribosome maturation factor RimM [Eubacteriales bacterium]|nr:ribosome maturation factor RimM [Eubacteriales bacterium]NLO13921.1 16S rRNA processing protein RimM [Clostridiales bacterium]